MRRRALFFAANRRPTVVWPRKWADATDHGQLTRTFDPHSHYLYLVAGGISREYSKQANCLTVLNALSLMQGHQIKLSRTRRKDPQLTPF